MKRGTALERGRDEVVTLREGRALGMAHYGDPGGTPVFFFHGIPGTRLEGMLLGESAKAAGVHLIALDRPGFGLSDFARRRTIGTWAEDVSEVATLLGIDRFGVIGVSGGAPYALACAARIPDRLLGVAFVSGAPPPEAPRTQNIFSRNEWIFRIGRYVAVIPRARLWWMSRKNRRNPDQLREFLLPRVPAADRVVLERDEVAAVLRADQLEAFRQGTRGMAHESRLFREPWDFRLEEIRIPVHVWQGEADAQTVAGYGRYVVSRLPHAVPHFISDGGHYSVIIEGFTEILAGVTERSTEQSGA